jgi:hypothetical protein
MVPVRLFLYGQPKWVINVHENISRMDLRRDASKMFTGRVRAVPEVYPVKHDTVVDCSPSFAADSPVLDVSMYTAVPCLVHRGRKYPIEVWPDVPKESLIQLASNAMGAPVVIHNDTHFPVRTDDEILIATEVEIKMEEMKLEKLREEDQIRARPPHPRRFRCCSGRAYHDPSHATR